MGVLFHWLEVHEGVTDDAELKRFYTSRPWRKKAAAVKKKFKYECQNCKARGRYSRATMVHHVMTARDYPALRLEEYYTDDKGERHVQLLPLCDACHELEHPDRLKQYRTKEVVSAERWD